METAARTSRPRVSRFAPLLVNAICIFTLHQSGSFCVAQVLKEQREQKLKLPMVTVTCINQSAFCSPCVREMWGHAACYKMPEDLSEVKWKTHKQPHHQYWVIQRLCCSSVIQQLISCGRLALKILFPSCACITRITINLNCLYILLWRYSVDQGGPHAQRESEFLTAELQNTQLARRHACAQNSHLQVTEKFTIIHCNIFRNHMEKKKERYLKFSVQTFQWGRKPTPKKPPKNKLEKKKFKKAEKTCSALGKSFCTVYEEQTASSTAPPAPDPRMTSNLLPTDFYPVWLPWTLTNPQKCIPIWCRVQPSTFSRSACTYLFHGNYRPTVCSLHPKLVLQEKCPGERGGATGPTPTPPVEDVARSTVSAAAARPGLGHTDNRLHRPLPAASSSPAETKAMAGERAHPKPGHWHAAQHSVARTRGWLRFQALKCSSCPTWHSPSPRFYRAGKHRAWIGTACGSQSTEHHTAPGRELHPELHRIQQYRSSRAGGSVGSGRSPRPQELPSHDSRPAAFSASALNLYRKIGKFLLAPRKHIWKFACCSYWGGFPAHCRPPSTLSGPCDGVRASLPFPAPSRETLLCQPQPMGNQCTAQLQKLYRKPLFLVSIIT